MGCHEAKYRGDTSCDPRCWEVLKCYKYASDSQRGLWLELGSIPKHVKTSDKHNLPLSNVESSKYPMVPGVDCKKGIGLLEDVPLDGCFRLDVIVTKGL